MLPDPFDQTTQKMPVVVPRSTDDTHAQPIPPNFGYSLRPFDSAPVVLNGEPDTAFGTDTQPEMRVSAPTTEQSTYLPHTRRAVLTSTLIVMAATILSRFLGLAREAIIAAKFGTTNGKGIYEAAFRVPDTLYLLIIGGALGSALIPVFTAYTGKGEMAKAWHLANAVITYAFSILLVFALFAFALAPQLAMLIAPGYNMADRQEVANLTRALLLSPIFLGLGGIAMAILNSQHLFTMPAIAPVVYNVFIIVGALVLGDSIGVYGLAVGVAVGAAAYLAIQIPPLLRLGLRFRVNFDSHTPGLRDILRLIGPRLFGQAAFQINFIVITAIASSYGQAAVASFSYGFTLMMLPHGIFAISVATVAFPTLSGLYAAGDLTGFRATFERSLRQIVFFALPSAVGLGVLAQSLVRSLYELGRFDAKSTASVAAMLIFFALALVPFGVIEICTRAFYAMQDTRTPVIASVLTVALNVALSLVLSTRSGNYQSLAFSLALTNSLEMVLLYLLLRRRLNRLVASTEAELFDGLSRMFAASVAMGVVLWLMLALVGSWLDSSATGKILVIIGTLAVIGIGALVYAPAAYALRLPELRVAFDRVYRRLRR